MHTREIVAVLIRRDDQYLFIYQDKEGGSYNGMWHEVAGGVEPEDQSLEAAVIRETRQEVGIEIKNIQYINYAESIVPHKGKRTKLLMHEYIADYASGEVIAGSDAQEAKWMTQQEMKQYKFNPETDRFLKMVGILQMPSLPGFNF